MDQAQPIVPRTSRGWQYYWNPWWREKHTYFTQLDIGECRRRLKENTTRFLGALVGRGLLSHADFSLFRVGVMKNSFKPYAHVKFREAQIGGTLVDVTLSSHGFVRGFMVLWLGFIAFWTVSVTIAGFRQPAPDLLSVLFGLGMAGFGLVLSAIGRSVGRGDPAFLLSFLDEQLGLTDPPPGSGPAL